MKMMAKRASRWPIVPLVALMLGAAVAFFCYAMPVGLVERLVVRLGLPAIIPATAPPLGATAQWLFAGAAGFATILAVIVGFAIGSRRGASERVAVVPVDSLDDFPRQRRADAHPDAPARRPIFAETDFGQPLDLALAEAAPALDAAEPVVEPEPPASWRPAPRSFEQDLPERDTWEQAEEAVTSPVDESVEAREPDEAIPPAIERWIVAEQATAADDAVAEDAIAEAEEADFEELPAAQDEQDVPLAGDAPSEPPPIGDASIAELMARLEAGLARRQATARSSTVTPLRAAPTPVETPSDKLRAALDELQRMAGRRT